MKNIDSFVHSRRDFLKIAGIAGKAAILAMAGCGRMDNFQNYHLKRDGHYPGIVVFAFDEEQNRFTEEDMQEKKDELILGSARFGEEYQGVNLPIEEWYKREAEKYGQEISIPLSFYPEQLKVPNEYITEKSRYSIDISKFRYYLLERDPKIRDYDFISVIYNDGQTMDSYGGDTFYKFKGDAVMGGSIFLARANIFIKNEYGKYILNETFAHEFAHLLGAIDKYGNFDPNDIYEYYDVMKYGRVGYEGIEKKFYGKMLEGKVIISEPTAREIGW